MTFRKLFLLQVLCSIIIILHVTSCHKTEDPDPGIAIQIMSPAENQIFKSGDQVPIKLEITANESIHGYEILEKNLTTGKVNVITERHTHVKTIHLEVNWTPEPFEKGLIELEVIVLANHEGLKTKAFRKIIYQ
jgi:hypothetical protein